MSGSRVGACPAIERILLATAALIAVAAPWAWAQDFAPVVPQALAQGVTPLLELGLPPRRPRAEWASGVARPFGLSELDAGWLAGGGGFRALRGNANE